MISIRHLSKRYPGGRRPALDDVSLDIQRGSIFGLLGPNGAGKTTLLSVLAGLLRADSGEIHLADRPLGAWRGRLGDVLGFVPQALAFYPMLTVAENLRFYAGVMGLRREAAARRIATAMETVQIGEYAEVRAERLSGGLKRRLNLAIGLLNDPKLLCLDEPTVGIDPHSRHYILERIRDLRDQGMTVIYTSHYMDEVQQLCDTVAIIESGRILVQDSLAALLERYSESRLQVRLAGGGEALGEGLRRCFPEASWLPAAGELELAAGEPVEVLARVRDLAGTCGARVAGFDFGRPRLEDVYLRLSGRSWDEEDAASAERD
ncbi:ABC transporter ATP-binding protein [Ectothiorhodospiraceae bacterium WFHF3C12]|nr:ABC transporter ATP-binding protein [Ectothiorhodospiraceae bacterium WFHF3C12]